MIINRIYETQNLSLQLVSFLVLLRTYQHPCILFDGENISFDATVVIYINSTNIPLIMIINRIFIHSFHWHVQNAVIPCRSQELLPFFPIINSINRIYEHQNLLSLQLVSFLVRLRTYQHPCIYTSSTVPSYKTMILRFHVVSCECKGRGVTMWNGGAVAAVLRNMPPLVFGLDPLRSFCPHFDRGMQRPLSSLHVSCPAYYLLSSVTSCIYLCHLHNFFLC